MIDRSGATRWVALALLALGLFACNGGGGDSQHVKGTVRSGNVGLAGFTASLYANFIDRPDGWQFLALSVTDANGDFDIFYDLPSERSVLVVEAERGPVMLASVVGYGGSVPPRVVVNERTTVATANAFAQFIKGRSVSGNPVGVYNAVRMASNVADAATGNAGVVISRTPNGSETSTFATFNSLANVVAACVARDSACIDLFNAARPPTGAAPDNVLQAVANSSSTTRTRTIPTTPRIRCSSCRSPIRCTSPRSRIARRFVRTGSRTYR